MSMHSQWLFKWLIPAGVSALLGLLLLSTLQWAASKTDEVARERQQDLISLIVSQLQAKIAHDQESATVWDYAVVKVAEGDVSWLRANLGEWMNTYFGHDAAILGRTIKQCTPLSPPPNSTHPTTVCARATCHSLSVYERGFAPGMTKVSPGASFPLARAISKSLVHGPRWSA